LVFSCRFVRYIVYTIFATPWVVLGYALTPDYHERTRLTDVHNSMGYVAYLISPWFLWFMQSDVLFDYILDGASWLAIIIGLAVIVIGIVPAIFCNNVLTKLTLKNVRLLH
jgi:GPH family glycoside/pentoside/hexuronide:cation symporter